MIRLECAPCTSREGHAAGRKLLQGMYEACTGKPMPPITLSETGKPFFPEGDLFFSISHTRAHVFCALSRKPVGVDAEELTRNISLSLADKILSPQEKAQFDAADDKRMALLTFWVLKEAQAKYTGEGLRGYPAHTNFSLDDPRVFTQDGCLVAVIEEDDHAL